MRAGTPLRFSVVVASHSRARWLARCLAGLRQLKYPAFEIVVVADSASLEVLRDHPVLANCKTIEFDEQNLSAARNRGIAETGGDVVAFIDDDAVPEPNWLAMHADALRRTGAAASVGYVRGRNGISFQSQASSVDREGETHLEVIDEAAPLIPSLHPGRALKLVGANAAIRREILVAMGGFDPAFRFYLEDADISLRLAEAGHHAAVAPLAEVHHAFAASVRRTERRMPRSLFDIGRSTAIYLRRHHDFGSPKLRLRMEKRERLRLIRHMVSGTCEPRDVQRLMSDLMDGWAEGLAADLPQIKALRASAPFKPVPQLARDHRLLSCRFLRRRRIRRQAAELVAQGHRVSVFSFSLSPIRHHLVFTEVGYWLQTGGQFGRSDRNSRLFRWCRFANRELEEVRRIAYQRGIAENDDQPERAEQRNFVPDKKSNGRARVGLASGPLVKRTTVTWHS